MRRAEPETLASILQTASVEVSLIERIYEYRTLPGELGQASADRVKVEVEREISDRWYERKWAEFIRKGDVLTNVNNIEWNVPYRKHLRDRSYTLAGSELWVAGAVLARFTLFNVLHAGDTFTFRPTAIVIPIELTTD